MDYVTKCNNQLDKTSRARCHAGDNGYMYTYGFHNIKLGDYKSMKDDNNLTREYCIEMKRVLNEHFPDVIKNIITEERKQGLMPNENMGGQYGISSSCIISEDLVNSPHFDLDISHGVSIFNESIPGKAKDWNFLLPNVMKDNDGNRGIAIRLFHGCCISWDGHEIYHCTGLRDKGNENHVYGNFFGAKQVN